MQPSRANSGSRDEVDRELRELSEGVPGPVPGGADRASGGTVLLSVPGRADGEPSAAGGRWWGGRS